MDIVVHAHAIPSIGTLTQVKTKAQVWLDLNSYFDELMRISTSPDLSISADIMDKHVVGLTALKTMMRILSDELDKGARVVYLDVVETRVSFQKDVTLEQTNTIMDYQSWHQYATANHNEDVKELVFQQLSES